MKKLLIGILLLVASIQAKELKEDNIIKANKHIYIFCDEATHVEYLVLFRYSTGGITPRIDRYGAPIICNWKNKQKENR